MTPPVSPPCGLVQSILSTGSAGDVKTLEKTAGLKALLYTVASARLIYLALDSSRDESPFVIGTDGQPAQSQSA